MNNINILALLQLPPPDYGVTLLNRNILDECLKRHFYVDYLSINTSKILKEIQRFSWAKVIFLLKKIIVLLRKLMSNRYRLCYFTIAPTGLGFYKDFFLVILLKLFKIKIIYHLHGRGIAMHKSLIERLMYKISLAGSKVIIISESLYGDIKEYVTRSNIYVLPNGIDDSLDGDEFEKIANLRSDKKNINLLFLSNMIESKGVYIALEAAKVLSEKNYDFKFYFAGEYYDVNEQEFANKLRVYGLTEKVETLGFKSGIEKYEVLKRADIFIHPTFNDTFPLVLLEAMQFGLPVVSTYEGAIPEMIDDGTTGFLVPQRDVLALAEKIETLLKNQQLREQMGKEARRKFLREYTSDKFKSRLVDILSNCFS